MKVFALSMMTLLWQGKGQDETLLIQTRNRATIALGSAGYEFALGDRMSSANIITCPAGMTLLKDLAVCGNEAWEWLQNIGTAHPAGTAPTSSTCYFNWLPEEGCMGHGYAAPVGGGITLHYQKCDNGYSHVTSYAGQVPICFKQAAAAPAAAGAYGDPHCVNAAGDWFDIHKIGRVPMAILPRGALPEDADFAVVANTMSPDGWDKCAPSFINSVEVLLNKTGDKVVIKAGQGQALEVKESNKNTDAYRLESGSDDVIMKKGPLALRVILNKVPTSDQSHFLYLDVEITGLKSLNAGGILGADSHDFAMDRPDGCDSTAMKKSKGVKASSAKAM